MRQPYAGKMQKSIPPGVKGDWEITHFTMTKKEVDFEKMRGMFHPGGYREVYDLEPGDYIRLTHRGQVVMSDTPMEIRTQSREVEQAHGACLVGGLGLGIFILRLQEKPEVTSILVVEKSQEVIDLVTPHLSLSSKVTILQGDVFDKKVVDRKSRFEFIYFDIWNTICGDHAHDVGKLKRQWRPLLRKDNPSSWIGAWREEDFAYLRREGNRPGLW